MKRRRNDSEEFDEEMQLSEYEDDSYEDDDYEDDYEEVKEYTDSEFADDFEVDDFSRLNASLKDAVNKELDNENEEDEDDEDDDEDDYIDRYDENKKKKKSPVKKFFTVIGVLLLVIAVLGAVLAFTDFGHSIVSRVAAKFISGNINHEEDYTTTSSSISNIGEDGKDQQATNKPVQATPTPTVDDPRYRNETYCHNYLIFGIEEIDGAMNTDTMMIATLNTKDKSVKFTSIMRDTYVEYNGRGMKLNAVFTAGRKVKDEDGNTTYSNDAGADALISVIQELTKVELEGYAFVGFSRPSNDKYKSSTDFNSMEEIVDILGGVDIELGKSEAAYLNRTNYIYNPANRNLVAGWNHLNGDQAQGYCRIRKVVTLGGYNNDYGRTVRQRRVIRAIFDAYKSSSITTILGKTAKCLALITTNLNEDDIYELIKDVADNGIKTMDENRLPIDGSFYDSGRAGYNGITYGLVIKEVEANPINMFMFLFGDSETEAYNNYNKLEGVTPVQVPTTQASTATINE